MVCMFRKLKPHQLVVDAVVALACFALELLWGFAGMLPFSAVALVGMAIALGLRRLSPAVALSIVWVTALIQVFFNIGPDISNVAIFPVLYATAAYGSSFIKWAGLISSGAGAFILTAYLSLGTLRFPYASGDIPPFPQSLYPFLILFSFALAGFTLSWTLGLLAKTWRKGRESAQARILAERARLDAQQSVVVEQERNRIARDMHDVVAHSLAVVIAQADGARYARDTDAAAVDNALATISATARDALGDVRLLLGQLRHRQLDAPQPVLADLERLYEQLRSAGLPIRVETSGDPGQLTGGAQLAVYRIVQEALTNALRHGESSEDTVVRFGWHSESLRVQITNPISARKPPAVIGSISTEKATHVQSHGISGMAERALLVGGNLSASALDGHFTIDVMIPLVHVEATE